MENEKIKKNQPTRMLLDFEQGGKQTYDELFLPFTINYLTSPEINYPTSQRVDIYG